MNKQYKFSSFMINGNLFSGIFGVIASVVMVLISGSLVITSIFGVAILLIVISSWMSKNPPLRFLDKHLEFKPAIAAPCKRIIYKEISKIDITDKKIIVFYSEDSREKKLKVPLNIFEKTERKAVGETFAKLSSFK